MLEGIGVSPGVVIGKAFLLDSEEIAIPRRRVSKDQVAGEIARFEEALIQTRSEILKIQKKIAEEIGVEHSDIFDAHLLVLEDRSLIEEVIGKVKEEGLAVEYAFQEVLRRYSQMFARIDDEYLRERSSDITDVGRRVLRNLLGRKRKTLADLEEEVLVVAYDLSPSDTALMHKEKVIGFATDIGGKTSHTAIMARALEIPAVVGLGMISRQVRPGDTLIIDGSHGVVVINPDKATLKKYRKEGERFEEFIKTLEELKDLPAQTLDGHKIELAANIELPEEISSVLAHGAEGVGLYRTEYFYMNRADLPSEAEHYEAYRKVAEQVAPHAAIIRTMDLGGDKFLSHLEMPREMNPFLGWRAIRFCLARPDIFKTQLRAILRASAHGKLRLMYPMISGIGELRQANRLLDEARAELRTGGILFDEAMEVGVMIETPSAALTCDILAREVDFFSIGTNDLIQYTLAVDRANEKIAYLYKPTHPAVLRLIKEIVDIGHRKGIWVGLCGEVSADPAYTILLVGLELDELSTSSVALPEIKKVIRSITLAEAKEIARHALTLSTADEIKAFVLKKVKSVAPEVLG